MKLNITHKGRKELYEINLDSLEVVKVYTSGKQPYQFSNSELICILGSIQDHYRKDSLTDKTDRIYDAHSSSASADWSDWVGVSIVENTKEMLIIKSRILGYDSDGEGLFTIDKRDYSTTRKVIKKHYN